MPEISTHLAAGRIRVVAVGIKLFSLDGMLEPDRFRLDTPTGILVLTITGDFLVRPKVSDHLTVGSVAKHS